MLEPSPTLPGRGTSANPKNRFERLELTLDVGEEADEPRRQTRYFKDTSRTFITYNHSPDIGYNAGANPYRGCEHGCVYCYARPTHEYLGFSAGLDFESKIMVKLGGPELLRAELASPKWKPQVIGFSGVTDIYQPLERKLKLTRRCLEVFADFRNPVGLVTKNHLITRDIDLLEELAKFDAVSVAISLTTLDEHLRRRMEPRTSTAALRLDAVARLAAAGIPVGVMTAPIIPGLNDFEIPALIKAAAQVGASFAHYSIVHLPYGVKELFSDWLTQHFPDRKAKVLNRIREMHGGRLNDPRFGYRMRGAGPYAEQIRALHQSACRRAGLNKARFRLSVAAFRVPGRASQPKLFD